MALERVWQALLALLLVLLVGVVFVQAGFVSAPWHIDTGEVCVLDDNGEPNAVVNVSVADTRQEQYTGLSNHDSLEPGEGMLFVHSSEDDRTYVMREMDFPIDIVFIGADREITEIHHARAPGPGEDGENLQYSGQAKWVLEVPRGYANETGMAVGDEVKLEYE